MANIRVLVPEAYTLNASGNQLDRLVVKYASTQADMEPQLSAFIANWRQESVSAMQMAVWASCDSTSQALKSWRSLPIPE
jgi:hypothetical protein